MPAAWLMVASSLLFSLMGVCVKLASLQYGAGEMVFYRGLVGAALVFGATRLRGVTLATRVPAMHFWRSTSDAVALVLWFYVVGHARGLALLLAIGVLGAVAQMLMTRAYHIGHTLSNASLQYLGIAFSFAFGVVMFDDPVTANALAGMAMIVAAGLAATSLRVRQQPDAPDTRHPPENA